MHELIQIIQKAQEDHAIYGASMAVAAKGKVQTFYDGVQGSGGDSIPLQPGMLYDLASLTKVVGTATRIFQLLAEKKLALNDQAGQFLTGLKYPCITIEQLLLHVSGLPADLPNPSALDKTSLIRAVKNAALKSQPSTQMIYSDLGFILLGWIIQQIDGSLSQSLKTNIFEPLEMQDTGFNPTKYPKRLYVPTEYQPERGGLIRGQVHDEKADILGGISGHAGLFSTLDDLVHFVQMLLNNGSYQGSEVLSPSIFELLKKHCLYGRTLGWELWGQPDDQDFKVWHTGFTGTSIALNLTKKTAFVCLTNRVYPSRANTRWLSWRLQAIKQFYRAF